MSAKLLTLSVVAVTFAFAQAGGPPPQQPNPPAAPPSSPANGPNNGPRGPISGLTQAEVALYNEGLSRFLEIDSVSGTQPGATGVGLGPRFNLNSCAGCHAQPGPGGTSPRVNPQIAVGTSFGATNTIPNFIQQNGPVRVVRFVRNPDGTPDGGVHDLFTITGRSDAAGCKIAQPDFATALQKNNAIFRIPTPLFGAGLIESLPDSAILANAAPNAQKAALGIAGTPNRSGNDGTITRFGWKAQNKSLMIFGGEAYNVEQGVTNELFPTERDETPGCVKNATPEDHTDTTASSILSGISDVTGFAAFMRFLGPLQPVTANASTARGAAVFASIGCSQCHTPSMKTGTVTSAALSNQTVNLYSDLLLHHMGPNLADGISQGLATGDEFRSAPLWGLSQRFFYLHDGRTSDLTQAILAHASPAGQSPSGQSYPASEANAVVAAFKNLGANATQDLLNFLGSL